MKHHWTLLLATVVLMPAPGRAADQLKGTCSGITAEITAAGLAHGVLKQEIKSSGTPSNVAWDMKNVELAERTSRIPLADGNMVLLRYKFSGVPKGKKTELTALWTFPTMISPDGRQTTRSARSFVLTGDAPNQSYWAFSKQYPFELVAGTWSFSTRLGDCVLIQKDFEMVKPQ